MTDTLADHIRDAETNLKAGIERLKNEENYIQCFRIPPEIHKAMHALSYAVMAVQDPQETLDAVRENARRLAEAKAADAKAEPLRAEIEKIIIDKMFDVWNDICSDTHCHPLDIEQVGRGPDLIFKTNHWSRQTAKTAADAILALAPPAVTQHGEPVAWRWRPRGATNWIYDPTAEWRGQQKGADIDIEPLFAAPPAVDRAAVIGWQPIEKAPKDGQFLVYLPNEHRQIQVMYRNSGSRFAVIGGAFAFDLTKPTHWMPLPEPPALADAKGDGTSGEGR
jgi:hypothetical protein